MKKYLKKFGIIFVMLLAVIGIGAIQNGTTANAATVGQQLLQPEIGWRRYDDTDSKINYVGNWGIAPSANYYNNGDAYTRNKADSYNFKFYGSKLRLISNMAKDRVNTIVNIDGIDYSYSSYSNITKDSVYLVFDTSLTLGTHTVNVKNADNFVSNTNYLVLDAIDIDDTGNLIYSNESISLDQSSMDINVGDSQQLTATTTPASVGVTWTSSDSSVATVDSNGNVTGVKDGTCTITATTADGLTATCTVTVSPKGTEPSNPTTGDANLYIELVDGQIKQYSVSSDEINKFTEWYENRDKDHSLKATYKFTKGTYTDYVVHDQIDWFEVR